MANQGDDDRFRTLPHEIFEEILSSLPVKSLIRSKTVSKSWSVLVSDKRFSKLYLKRSADENRMGFMVLHDYSQTTLNYKAPRYGSEKNRLILMTDESDEYINFLASCNGFFCLGNNHDKVCFWNPSTRESKRIPGARIEFPHPYCTRALVFFGLGYHSSADDYKLLRISMFDGMEFRTEVKIYSRNNNIWRRIKDFPYDRPDARPGVFVSENLHWVVSMWCNEVHIYSIAAFNLEDENYGLIQLPDFGHKVRFLDIGTLGENLILFCCYYKLYGYGYDIWVLDEYGKTETWTRIKIMTSSMKNNEALAYFEPLCLMGPDAILIRTGRKKFVMYDAKRKQCLEFMVPQMIKETRIVSYVESLESPNA